MRLTYATILLLIASFAIDAQLAKDRRLNALLLAASANEVAAAQKLLDEGVNVSAVGKYGETALMLGAHHPEMVATLLKAGARVNAQNNRGATPLMYSMLDYRDGARFLLAAGADVNSKAKNGMTALMMAAYEGRIDKIEMLIKAELTLTPRTNTASPRWLTHANETKPMQSKSLNREALFNDRRRTT